MNVSIYRGRIATIVPTPAQTTATEYATVAVYLLMLTIVFRLIPGRTEVAGSTRTTSGEAVSQHLGPHGSGFETGHQREIPILLQ